MTGSSLVLCWMRAHNLEIKCPDAPCGAASILILQLLEVKQLCFLGLSDSGYSGTWIDKQERILGAGGT